MPIKQPTCFAFAALNTKQVEITKAYKSAYGIIFHTKDEKVLWSPSDKVIPEIKRIRESNPKSRFCPAAFICCQNRKWKPITTDLAPYEADLRHDKLALYSLSRTQQMKWALSDPVIGLKLIITTPQYDPDQADNTYYGHFLFKDATQNKFGIPAQEVQTLCDGGSQSMTFDVNGIIYFFDFKVQSTDAAKDGLTLRGTPFLNQSKINYLDPAPYGALLKKGLGLSMPCTPKPVPLLCPLKTIISVGSKQCSSKATP